MSAAEKFAHVMDRFLDAMRHKGAFTVRPEDATDGGFEGLRGQKYAVLITFRRSGEPVPSPVWFGLDDEGRAYMHTGAESAKVKRFGNDPRVLLVASNSRGKPKGKPVWGTARVVPEDEWPHAEAALARAYGAGRKVFMRAFGSDAIGTYIEVAPGRPAD